MEHTVSGVGVLDKSVAVLSAVADAATPRSLGDLVSSTGLPKATVHRLAVALESHGLLRRDGSGAFLLGLRMIGLGRAATEAWPVVDVARAPVGELRRETGESAQLYVREGEERVCVLSLESGHELRTIVAEGARLPVGLGSAGRVLSGEPSTSGWVASLGERAPGVGSVSAPVVDGHGQVVAAVGVSGPLERLGGDPGGRYGDAVRRAAERISAGLIQGIKVRPTRP
ncbi:MAG: IclR family transcriptional regulator [Aquihabitans sp.]